MTEALEHRNALLFSLRDLDEHLRSLYPVTEENRQKVTEILKDRDDLCRNIREMGAVPWTFSIKGDNSWLK